MIQHLTAIDKQGKSPLRVFALASFLLAILASSFGCSPAQIEKPVMDYGTLLGELRASGASVAEVGEANSGFVAVKGKVIKLNGSSVQIYEYQTPNAMQSDTANISADGFTINGSSISWIAPPHLYKSGRVFATYLGNDGTIIGILEAALGKQFAGASLIPLTKIER